MLGRFATRKIARWPHRRRFLSSIASRPPPSLDKVLIANRGEIACRVIRTCQALQIPTVAIYSSADGRHALHASMADEAYEVGSGPTPAESYLLQDEIIEIALQTGTSAIHGGYGFLSENAGFCQKVGSANIAFVGPPPSAIQAMGSKSESKAIMDEAGVPTTPGYYGEQDSTILKEQADLIGYPVLIKAVMGGGGKGMRLVDKPDDFVPALEACQRESQASFGDSAVLLEKYLVQPRHVEVQVVADSHGNVVSLHERDCSLQRRHQKIIEEAPASDLPRELREQLGAMGRRAAKAVGYVNVGTVEFLLDRDQNFYFCEMNTRLQVEHPITELITGVDLVEWQLRIAAGETLPITSQEDIPCNGHAFEARIYAENPARNFLPATGTVWHHEPPAPINASSVNGIRVDTGLQSCQHVGVYYDPMISKLIVHDQDRPSALRKLIRALKEYEIAGVPTNIDFLTACAEHPVFGQAGAINTGFLEDYADDVQMVEAELPSPLAQSVGACAVMLLLENRVGVDSKDPVGPWSSRSGSWRMGGSLGRARRTLTLESGEEVVCLCNADGSYDVQVVPDEGAMKEASCHVSGTLDSEGKLQAVINETRRLELKTALRMETDMIRVAMWHPQHGAWTLNIHHGPKAFDDAGQASSGAGLVKSPMPGRIRRIACQVGDHVEAGQVILVLEAMKMEHSIEALRDGVLTDIRCEVDEVVQDGAVLLVVGDEEEETHEEKTG